MRIIFIVLSVLIADISAAQTSLVEKATEPKLKYELTISLGSVGRVPARLRPTTIEIREDSIRIINCNYYGKKGNFSLCTDSTKIKELISEFNNQDLLGDKDYSQLWKCAATYMNVKSTLGNRRFVAVFSLHSGYVGTKPDTIGLQKFKALYDYIFELLK